MTFSYKIDGKTGFGGYPKNKGPKCPRCEKKRKEVRDVIALERDVVWEETKVQCNKCGYVWWN